MTTYTWTEHHMSVLPTEAGLTNVVKRVQADYTADDGANIISQMIVVVLNPPDPGNFTPYEDLTLVQVIGWIEEKVNTASLQASLDTRLAQLAEVPMACPWD